MLDGIVENTVAATAIGGFDKSIPLAGHKFRYRFSLHGWRQTGVAGSTTFR
jgi:hypothetical protein